MLFCRVFQVLVPVKTTWCFVALLRSYEHLCFDRTKDVSSGLFEIFVPQDLVINFLEVMNYLHVIGVAGVVYEVENRLINTDTTL
jgi:hypothetical protein